MQLAEVGTEDRQLVDDESEADSGQLQGPSPRWRGMLGQGPDEFPEFDGWQPPARRSEIETFDVLDAEILLNGDGTPGGHGYHRYGLNIKPSEFPPGWNEPEVITWVNAIIDHPTWADPDPDDPNGFYLYGSYLGLVGTLAIRRYGRWIIATAIPDDLRSTL